jgi:hypothetical protein
VIDVRLCEMFRVNCEVYKPLEINFNISFKVADINTATSSSAIHP